MLGLRGSGGRGGRRRDVGGTVATGPAAAPVSRPPPEFVAVLLVEAVKGLQGMKDFVPCHSGATQALKQVDLLYGESGFICVVEHGFQQTGKQGQRCKAKHKHKYPFTLSRPLRSRHESQYGVAAKMLGYGAAVEFKPLLQG